MRAHVRHLAHFLGTKRPVKLVTVIFIIFIVILVIFSLPGSGDSWCKAVTPDPQRIPEGWHWYWPSLWPNAGP